MVFFIGHILGIRTEALRTTIIYLAPEHVPSGEAFHQFLVASGILILGIVAQEEVGADRIGAVHLIEPAFSAFVWSGLFSM